MKNNLLHLAASNKQTNMSNRMSETVLVLFPWYLHFKVKYERTHPGSEKKSEAEGMTVTLGDPNPL